MPPIVPRPVISTALRPVIALQQSLGKWWPFPWPSGSALQPKAVRDRVRAQVAVIRAAHGADVAVYSATGDDGDAEFLYVPGVVLVLTGDVERMTDYFRRNDDRYYGIGVSLGEPIEGLTRWELPRLTNPARPADVIATLDHMDMERVDESKKLAPGTVTPDHYLHVMPGHGFICPASEPEVPDKPVADPPVNPQAIVGGDVRVSVVDTGWWAAAKTNKSTSWLAKGVDGDPETGVDANAIREYAGHGTFVAGVVRSFAPGAQIWVDGFLTKGGAVSESDITMQLNEALLRVPRPHVISLSAGGRTRKELGMLGFIALSRLQGLVENDEAPLIVAAAGNDGSTEVLYPAAFPWVVGVGSVDDAHTGAISDFSNYGHWVDIYARGRDLVNAYPSGTYRCFYPENVDASGAPQVRTFTGLAKWSGTSFSTPVVTGLIVAKMHESGLSPRAAFKALQRTSFTDQTKVKGGYTYDVVGP